MKGQAVQVRDALGKWHDTVALSEPRWDHENAAHRGKGAQWPSVSVRVPGWDHPINWPADAVRSVS